MKNYDFHQLLEPLEFQEFARDMIQVREKIDMEAFREGPDQGIDARCITPEGRCIILQAKRWANDGGIRWKELREEKKKADRIKPDRYILVLARDVSPEQKKKIRELFHPFILADNDIVTGKDLNNYLGSGEPGYARVEEKYYKLWIRNTEVLKNTVRDVVNGELLAESRLEWEKARQNAEFFVETAVYEEARKLLAAGRAIILSGEPGIGKTTLANQLAIYWLSRRGFDTYLWAESVGDLYKAQEMPGKKVVIYDDFWGSNFLNAYGAGKEERRLARLIESVRLRNDYVLILTTREYVLEQGMRQNEELRALLERYKLECRLHSYSLTDMVRIYLGHLRKSSLTWEQMKALYRIHDQVVLSPYYNPRIIQMYLGSVQPGDRPEQCAQRMLQYLQEPKDFWEQIFQNLSEEARVFFIILDLMPLPVNLERAHQCYQAAMAGEKEGSLFRESERVIAELEKTAIYTETVPEAGNALRVRFQNPSANDFIHQYISRNFVQYRELLLRSCCYFECCRKLLSLCALTQTDGAFCRRVMERAIDLEYRCFFEYNRDYYSYYELLQVYRNPAGEPFRKWFTDKFRELLSRIKRDSADVSTEDLKEFPAAAGRAIEYGFYRNKEEAAAVYFEAMMKNRLPFQPGDMPANLKVQGNVYIKAHREEINRYLEWYYKGELCLAAVENNVFYFDDLRYDMERSQEEAGVEFSRELLEKREKYALWLDEDKIEWEEDSEEEIEDEHRYDEAVEEFGKSMEEIYREDWAAVRESIRYSSLDREAKFRLVEIGQRKEPWYWYDFLKNESATALLIRIIEKKGRLPMNLKEAAAAIFSYLTEMTGGGETELECFIRSLRPLHLQPYDLQALSRQLYEKRDAVMLSGKELEEKAERYFAGQGEEIIRALCACGFLRRWNQWYCQVNPGLFFISELHFFAGSSQRGKEYLCLLWFIDTDWDSFARQFAPRETEMLEGLVELDRDAVIRYALQPLARKFCEDKGNAEGMDLCRQILNCISLECYVSRRGEVLGGSGGKDILWELLYAVADVAVWDILPDCFSAEQMSMLRTEGGLEETEHWNETCWLLDTARMKEEVLKESGIAERVRELWEEIKSYSNWKNS